MTTAYTAIPNADIDPESPITTGLITLLRDNPIAIAEGAAGAPAITGGSLEDTTTSANHLLEAQKGWSDATGPYGMKKIYEIKIGRDGVLGTELYMNNGGGEGAYHSTGQIYINGVAAGTFRDSGYGISSGQWSEDINVVAGDLLQMYIAYNGTSPYSNSGWLRVMLDNPVTSALHYNYS